MGLQMPRRDGRSRSPRRGFLVVENGASVLSAQTPQSRRSRTPGCDFLAKAYPHPADEEDIMFDESSHTYTYRGVVVEKSCTALVSQNFEVFDAWGTVCMFYERWKHNQDDRYWDIIGLTQEAADGSRIDDFEAQRRIVARWEGLRADAARKGTLLHTYCERSLNRAPTDPPISMNGFEDIVQEVVQHDAFMRSHFITEHALVPYATELLVLVHDRWPCGFCWPGGCSPAVQRYRRVLLVRLEAREQQARAHCMRATVRESSWRR